MLRMYVHISICVKRVSIWHWACRVHEISVIARTNLMCCVTQSCVFHFSFYKEYEMSFFYWHVYIYEKKKKKTWTFATRRNHAHKCTPVLHFPFQTHTPFQMCATLFAHSLWFHFILLALLTKLISYLRIFLTYLKLHCPTDTTLQRSIHSAVKFSCPWNMTILPLQLINMLHYVLKC